ncbi:MAG: hypothetical protein J3K34DRAFT_83888 [Monoraphidium minutum]|nr:MAG: hypothetical protein J3K34DRAFT_83888 [Monoraphidium minutum]
MGFALLVSSLGGVDHVYRGGGQHTIITNCSRECGAGRGANTPVPRPMRASTRKTRSSANRHSRDAQWQRQGCPERGAGGTRGGRHARGFFPKKGALAAVRPQRRAGRARPRCNAEARASPTTLARAAPGGARRAARGAWPGGLGPGGLARGAWPGGPSLSRGMLSSRGGAG